MTTITPINNDDNHDASTALVEATGSEMSLHAALHLDKHFVGAARDTDDDDYALRNLTWLTGNNECFASNGKTPLPAARGWFLDQPDEDVGLFPQDYALLSAMETLCKQGKAAPCVVVYQDKQGKPRRKASWALPVASLFVVAQGVPSKKSMENDPERRWGIAYAWPKGVDPKTGKPFISRLHFVAFMKELMDAGYSGGFAVRFSSYLTDRALSCLMAHYHTLKFADALRLKAGETEGVAYYAYALPIQCSLVTTTAGTKVSKTTEIYYPVPGIPYLSANAQEASEAFLDSVAITYDQALLLENDGRVEQTVEWSVAKSKAILTGNADAPADPNPDADDASIGASGVVDPDGNPIESPF